MNDDELIEGLRRRDRNVQEAAYATYKTLISSAVKKYVKQTEDIEELVQDVFVKVFMKIDQFAGNSKISTWMMRIAINTALNFVESVKKKNEIINTSFGLDKEYEWISDITDPEELLINQEKKNLLIKAAELLPVNQKTAFLLFYVEGLSQLEISDIMGKSIDAVESIIQRSKIKFKSLFKINSIN